MNKKTDYYEKLKDPRWQKKRLEIFNRDDFKCRFCGVKDKSLHVHHIVYARKVEPWDIPNGLLITLCEECHLPKPCNDNYETCDKCENFADGTCDGPGDPPGDIMKMVGGLLQEIFINKKLGFYVDDIFWHGILKIRNG